MAPHSPSVFNFFKTFSPPRFSMAKLLLTLWVDIEQTYNYGFDLLDGLDFTYNLGVFVHDIHQMYLSILLVRFDANQVLHTTPHTPTDILSPPHSIHSSTDFNVQLPGDVSPISVLSSPG